MKHHLRGYWVAALAVACAAMLMPTPPVSAASNKRAPSAATSADGDFIALREAGLRGDTGEAGRLSARLLDYPIPSYVDYYRLYPRLAAATEGEIRSFLERYDGSAIADRLRNDWLLLLGRAHDWRVFDEHYPRFVLNDDTQLKCYALMSRAAKAEPVASVARELLMQPKHYGEACIELIGRLLQDRQFSEDDVWRQVRLAVEYGQPVTARRIAGFIDVNDKQLQQAIEKPAPLVERGASGVRAARELFLIALGRFARDNPERALLALQRSESRLTPAEQATGWAQLALQASLALAREAPDYWRRTWGAALSSDGYQWRARAGLRIGDWPMVLQAIDAMPGELRQDPAWVYWRGRALAALGQPDDARRHFQQFAGQPHFYGQLSTEELGLSIMPPSKPAAPTAQELADAEANPGLRDALKFLELGLRFEATREWNWQLRKMSDRQLLAAAELARRNDVLDRMVAAADRTRDQHDLAYRYPTPHDDIMHGATQPIGLDKAWVYGLIRQESRFIKSARSVVGASGLMQIMPNTANYVAKKIGMTEFTLAGLNDTRTNITLGTQYLNMVLANLGGSQTLATAAYNAGPGRPRQWRARLERAVEGAIFAETIPFSETRGYVKNVLANATWYAAQFENRPQSLKARLGVVTPREPNFAEVGDLP